MIEPLTVLSYGGGQDSTAILLQLFKMSHGHCVASKY